LNLDSVVLQLSELAATVPNLSVWAIVKETGVDDEGLLDFAANYFPFPVFKDKSCLIYKAMGDRKISYWGLFTGLFKSSSRIRTKNIGTTFAGEGWIQGGVLIFNRKNHLVYALEENFGNELNAGDIKLAIEAARS
jgi:AhpC/TSA antioxidant enzyme